MLINPERKPREKLPLLSTGGRENEPGSAGKTAGEAPWGCPRSPWNGHGKRCPFPTRLGKVTARAGGWEGFAAYEQCEKMGKRCRAWTRALQNPPELSEGTELSPRNVCAVATAPSPAGHKLSPSVPFSPHFQDTERDFGPPAPQSGDAARSQLCHNKKATLRERLERTRL